MSDLDGKIVARWPAPSPETEGKDLRRRDYYQGALGLAKTEGGAPVYISRVYKAFSDDLYKFGIAAAVRDGEKIVGVLAASVTTSRQMGLPETESDEFTTALVARKDPFFAPGEPRCPRRRVGIPGPCFIRPTSVEQSRSGFHRSRSRRFESAWWMIPASPTTTTTLLRR